MRYRETLFLSIVVVVCFGFAGWGYSLMREIRSQYSISLEESMVDFSNVLASYLSAQVENDTIFVDEFAQTFKNFRDAKFRAEIHGVTKEGGPFDAYVTDSQGVVLYDSRDPGNVGRDFSNWNDVYKTLSGQYGARSTRTNIQDPLSSVFFVAAPIQSDGRIIGVISVIKPEASLQVFVGRGHRKIFILSMFALLGAVVVASLFSYLLTKPISSLKAYAEKVARGESVRPQKFLSTEFQSLAMAFDEMRISLEGKKQVENFVQHLVHELKSPLTAIQGASELLREDMSEERKTKFLDNIERESTRAKNQLEDLLRVAALESRSKLSQVSEVSLLEVVNDCQKSLAPLFEKKNLKIDIKKRGVSDRIKGDRELLYKVVQSLLSNAIDFSPKGRSVQIEIVDSNQHILLFVRDQGPGIPEYAKGRIFEKFYSLARPETGQKSTGLGLNFVKEAIALHGGEVAVVPSRDPYLGANLLITLNK